MPPPPLDPPVFRSGVRHSRILENLAILAPEEKFST